MKISEFIEMVNTTKDTVRYYEELEILRPSWIDHRRNYTEQDITDFEVIKEMKNLGLSMKDIQMIFKIKRETDCNSKELISSILLKLNSSKEHFETEVLDIQNKLQMIEELIIQIKKLTNA
ncbi:MerR family transcriptional regulator [Rummeliibacillus pycnus]|uniref:helix-turn-helix domain-containing protein n=1 Tax=Rummeliibacillus pycnus TaxID=101070 RepID=UPI003D2DD03F